MIVLTNSQAAIALIKKAGKIGKARTRELRKVMRKIEKEKKALRPKAVCLEWVKSHVGIESNKEADKKAKLDANEEDLAFPVITEGGLKEVWKKLRKEERCMRGTGDRRVVKWERKVRVSYVHCRTNKGNLQSWQNKLYNSTDSSCRFCSNHMETDKHVALIYSYGEEIGRR